VSPEERELWRLVEEASAAVDLLERQVAALRAAAGDRGR
jgi:hypothetical protein